MPYLIIGVDPGHTIGLAALDLSGHPVRITHIQQGGFGAALSALESWGTPSLVASDVRPAPELVLKLASAFNAALFVPERPWREDDKRQVAAQMLEQFSFPVENVHERDALSAAVQGWRAHQNMLRGSAPAGFSDEETDILRHLLLQGIRHTAALEMISKLRQPEAEKERMEEKQVQPVASAPGSSSRRPSSSRPEPLSSSSLSLERTVSELRKRVSFLEAERETLMQRIRLLQNGVAGERMANHERLKMAAQIQRLQNHIHYLNKRRGRGKEKQFRPSPSTLPARPQTQVRPSVPAPKPSALAAPHPPPVFAKKTPPAPHSPASTLPQPSPPSPSAPDGDLKKLNALRLQRMIEEYRLSRISSSR
ncbi:Uncharacterised protein [uncultured archaeon]|nr:Uncharacterised protein [uncultured archaeon]